MRVSQIFSSILVLGCTVCFSALAEQPAAEPPAHAMQLFATSPALFVENQGQFKNSHIRFLHHGEGALIALTDRGPIFQLRRDAPVVPQNRNEELAFSAAPLADFEAAALISAPVGLASVLPGVVLMNQPGVPFQERVWQPASVLATVQQSQPPGVSRNIAVLFPGARTVQPSGGDRSASTYNYHKGAGSEWRSNVPTWESAMYHGLYPGIDLKVWGRRDHLKYEFHVVPGADPSQVRIGYEGIASLAVEPDGTLRIDPGAGWEPLRDEKPFVYQNIDGGRIEIPSRYRLIDARTYTIELLAPYDPVHELVVDPEIGWGTYLGGADSDGAFAVAFDNRSSIYVTGITYSADWMHAGLDDSFNGIEDIFLTKLTTSGDHVWSTYLGGDRWDWGLDVAVDSMGDVYVAGMSRSEGWLSGGYDTTVERSDAIIVKLNPDGEHIWSSCIGGSDMEYGRALDIDADGNIYVTGSTESLDWVSGGFDNSYQGYSDGFLAKLSPQGEHQWSTYFGGWEIESGEDIVTVEDAVYVAGHTYASDWVYGGYDTTYGGRGDGLVIAVSSGGEHIWSTYVGGEGRDDIYSIATDGTSGLYVAGSKEFRRWTGGEEGESNYDSNTDVMVVKLAFSGQESWSTTLGGSDIELARAIDVAGDGVYLCGETLSRNWDDIIFENPFVGGECDMFLTRLTPDGGHIWTALMGGEECEGPYDVLAQCSGDIFIAGTSYSENWLSGGFDTTYDGGNDSFVLKVTDSTPITDCSTGPCVTSILPLTLGPTTSTTLLYAVTFDQSVIDFEPDDLAISHVNTSHSGATVAGGPAAYTVSLDGVTGDGPVALNVRTGNGVTNEAGEPLQCTVDSAVVMIDNTRPVVTFTADAGPLVNGPVSLTATFSEPVQVVEFLPFIWQNAGFRDFSFNGEVMRCTLDPFAEGTFSMSLWEGTVHDLAGNPCAAARIDLTYDATPPLISNLRAIPLLVHPGDRVRLSYDVNEPLSSSAITVNGTALPVEKHSLATHEYYVVDPLAPMGPVDVAVVAHDMAGNLGAQVAPGAFSVVASGTTIPISFWPVWLGLGAAGLLILRRRTR